MCFSSIFCTSSLLHRLCALVLSVVVWCPMAYADNCTLRAAEYHTVNPWLLSAILWQESHWQPHSLRSNPNGSTDYGIAQINSIHLRELKTYGIGPADLMDACVGAYVAAWHLRRQVLRYGNTWFAVGAYHSITPAFNRKYAASICRIVLGWQMRLPTGDPGGALSADFVAATAAACGQAV